MCYTLKSKSRPVNAASQQEPNVTVVTPSQPNFTPSLPNVNLAPVHVLPDKPSERVPLSTFISQPPRVIRRAPVTPETSVTPAPPMPRTQAPIPPPRRRPGVNAIKLFSFVTDDRPNKLEGLPLITLSNSWVLEFEGKTRANPIGGPFRCFLLG